VKGGRPDDGGARPRVSRARVREYAIRLIDQILELQWQTDPALGVETAREKDFRSFEALDDGLSAHALLGWAIAHNVGLALADLEFVPLRRLACGNFPNIPRLALP
jgi:hypothetical protein